MSIENKTKAVDDFQDNMTVTIWHNFLVGEKINNKIYLKMDYFAVKKDADEIEKLCDLYQKKFNERLSYTFKRGLCYITQSS